MSWSLSASGHTPTPEGASGWAEVEQELHDELQKILSNPRFGATVSQFGGNHVTSNALHLPKDDPEVEHLHETTDALDTGAADTTA